MEAPKPCWAVATSGVPVREQLFNASICHHGAFNVNTNFLEVAAPILLQRKDGHRHRKGSHGDIKFLTNHGEVASYTPGLHGHDAIWRWQLSTDATWSNLPSASDTREGNVVPTLKVMSLRHGDEHEVILAAGEQEAVIISPGGSDLT